MSTILAEIHNKISGTGSNLSDRLEDQLTGDVFGALRYLPYELGLQNVLTQVRFPNEASATDWEACLESVYGYDDVRYEFWPFHREGEIDLRVVLPGAMLGIEVKYGSGLSSEDDEVKPDMDPAESCNQLIRYSRMLEETGGSRSKFLIFLAPLGTLHAVEQSMKGRAIAGEVKLGYLSWQAVLEAVQELRTDSLEVWQRLILQDIRELLTKKGFVRFQGFHRGLEEANVRSEAYQFQGGCGAGMSIAWPDAEIREDLNYVYHRQLK